jgi:hypothetical protein
VAGWIAQDYSRAQKSDAGENSLHNAADRIRVGPETAISRSEDENGGDGSTHGDERMSPQACRFSMQLTIQTENRANHQGGPQPQRGFFISA